MIGELVATRAAIAEGIAGGFAPARAIEAVHRAEETLSGDQRTGARIVASALAAPLRQIAESSGIDAVSVAGTLLLAEASITDVEAPKRERDQERDEA